MLEFYLKFTLLLMISGTSLADKADKPAYVYFPFSKVSEFFRSLLNRYVVFVMIQNEISNYYLNVEYFF